MGAAGYEEIGTLFFYIFKRIDENFCLWEKILVIFPESALNESEISMDVVEMKLDATKHTKMKRL